MSQDRQTDAGIARILRETSTIALVGASADPARPSYGVMAFMLSRGYIVTPVNPGLEGQEIQGCQVYAALADIPGPVDMVDVFRNSAAALAVVREAIAIKSKLGIKVVWMQLRVINADAAREAEGAGLEVVMDRCPKIETGRLAHLLR